MNNMADTIHTTGDSGGMGFFMGMIVLVLLVLFVIFYGVPMMRRSGGTNVPNVTVPDEIDVNINQPEGK